jgi:inosose dehydratase
VPGDGALDFHALLQRLADYGYEGWFVVEAEQDPVKAPPLEYAKIGHAALVRALHAAGYEIEA